MHSSKLKIIPARIVEKNFTPLPGEYDPLPPILHLSSRFPSSTQEQFPRDGQSRNVPLQIRLRSGEMQYKQSRGWRAWIQLANSLDNGISFNRAPAFADFVRDLFHFCLHHLLVRFIFRVCGFTRIVPSGYTAYYSGKNRRRTCGCKCNSREQVVQVNFVFSDGKDRRVVHTIIHQRRAGRARLRRCRVLARHRKHIPG